jgi:hypothetical protein
MHHMMSKASSRDTLLMLSVPLVSLSVLTVVGGLLCHSVTSLAVGGIGIVAAMAIQFHEPSKKSHSLLVS